MGVRRLPEHLEFYEYDGIRIHGHGPFIVFLKDKTNDKIFRLVIRIPEGGSCKEFMTEFDKQLFNQFGVHLKDPISTSKEALPERQVRELDEKH